MSVASDFGSCVCFEVKWPGTLGYLKDPRIYVKFSSVKLRNRFFIPLKFLTPQVSGLSRKFISFGG